MVRICSNCGTENPEGAFWCNNCDKILLKEKPVFQKTSEEIEQKMKDIEALKKENKEIDLKIEELSKISEYEGFKIEAIKNRNDLDNYVRELNAKLSSTGR